MKKYIFMFAFVFCFNLTSQAQFIAPEPVATCNQAGPNEFQPTHHETFNFFGYSETHVYGNLVNPCGDVVGTTSVVYTRNWE